jgi:hypothetical protein
MSMSEKSRNTIYQTFQPQLGEEATEEMLSYFPARDLDEPVTKEFLRAELAEGLGSLRTELHDLHHRFFVEMFGLVSVAVAILSFTT